MKITTSKWMFATLAILVLSIASLSAQDPAPQSVAVETEPSTPELAEEPAGEEESAVAVAESSETAESEESTESERPAETVEPVEAAVEISEAVIEEPSSNAEDVKAESSTSVVNWRGLWNRLVTGLLSVGKALAVLAAFWIAALILGAAVTKGLSLTDLDNKLVTGLGLNSLLVDSQGHKRSLESALGTAVKWLVLLFGFVAFFQMLNLSMVAGPLQNISDKIVGVVPTVLYALVILAVYWIVATVVKLLVIKGLGAIGFDRRAGDYIKPREVNGEMVGPSGMIGRLLFYIVLLLGILPFLEALGQESLVEPLRDMFSKVFAFLPNIFGAIIIFFIGKIVATIVREVVTNLIAAAGIDELAENAGIGGEEGGKRLSDIVGSIAFFFIIILVGIQAIDTLKIDAISVPVSNTLQQLLAAIPPLIGGFIIAAIGYYVAKMVGGFIDSFLRGVGFDQLPEKVGLSFLAPKAGGATLSTIAGQVVMVVVLLLIAAQALAMMQLESLAAMVSTLLSYLPNLAVGLAVILAALSLGNYVAGVVSSALSGSAQGGFMAAVARYAIYFLGISMGLTQLGVGEEVVKVAVSAVLGGAALALGIAFGLGGKEKAKEIIDRQSSGM